MTLRQMHERLRERVAEYRYGHAVRTAETAREIAARFGLDEDAAYTAGLLHDCAKLSDNETDMLALARGAGIEPTPAQRAQPVELLHAQVSAYIARRDYGVEDERILSAIALHQSGAPGMTELDMTVGLADATEPNRGGREDVREMLKSDLAGAYTLSFVQTMKMVIDRGFLMEESKIDTYNWLMLRREAP